MDFCREWCFSPGNLDEQNVVSQSQPARRCEKHVAARLRGDREYIIVTDDDQSSTMISMIIDQ